MTERQRREFVGASCVFPSFSDEACAIVKELLQLANTQSAASAKVAVGLSSSSATKATAAGLSSSSSVLSVSSSASSSAARPYLTASVHSVYAASDRREQLREGELAPVFTEVKRPYSWQPPRKAVSHTHSLLRGEMMRIIDADYFHPRWSEKYLDTLRSLPWMNASEWIESGERMGMVCTGTFARLAHANRLYPSSRLDDKRQFLCVMDDFLAPGECKRVLEVGEEKGKLKKLVSPFVAALSPKTQIKTAEPRGRKI